MPCSDWSRKFWPGVQMMSSEDADSADLGGTAIQTQAPATAAPIAPPAALAAAAVADGTASDLDGVERSRMAGSKTTTPRDDGSHTGQGGGITKLEEMMRSLGVVEEGADDDDEEVGFRVLGDEGFRVFGFMG
jgi:hypothetical protein